MVKAGRTVVMKNKHKWARSILTFTMTMVVVLSLLLPIGALNPTPVSAQPPTKFNLEGYRANVGGGGSLNTGWRGGELGNTWREGEWVPYKLVITDVQNGYPLLAGFPDLVISYDFYNANKTTWVKS